MEKRRRYTPQRRLRLHSGEHQDWVRHWDGTSEMLMRSRTEGFVRKAMETDRDCHPIPEWAGTADLGATMDCPRFRSLRFEPRLECLYRERQRTRLRPLARIGPVAGALLVLAFGVWDRHLDPGHLSESLAVHAAVATVLLAVAVTSFTRFGVTAQDALVAAGLLAGVGGVALIGTLGPAHLDHIPAGLLLVLLFGTALTADLRIQAGLSLGYVAIPNIVMRLVGTPDDAIATVNWFVVAGAFSSLLLAFLIDTTNRRAFLLEVALERERQRSEALLRSILPASIVERLKGDAVRVADLVEDASVLFADIVGFTALARHLPPAQLIELLDRVFTDLDDIAVRHGAEKIKTIGDAYMVAVGVADAAGRDISALAELALEARNSVWSATAIYGAPLQLRIGLCAGPVISGVIGRRKPHFDLWGDTVNTASRLESSGVAGEIQVDEHTYMRLRGAYEFEPRGAVELKGIGPTTTYLLKGRRSPGPGRRDESDAPVATPDRARPGRPLTHAATVQ